MQPGGAITALDLMEKQAGSGAIALALDRVDYTLIGPATQCLG